MHECLIHFCICALLYFLISYSWYLALMLWNMVMQSSTPDFGVMPMCQCLKLCFFSLHLFPNFRTIFLLFSPRVAGLESILSGRSVNKFTSTERFIPSSRCLIREIFVCHVDLLSVQNYCTTCSSKESLPKDSCKIVIKAHENNAGDDCARAACCCFLSFTQFVKHIPGVRCAVGSAAGEVFQKFFMQIMSTCQPGAQNDSWRYLCDHFSCCFRFFNLNSKMSLACLYSH